MNMNRTNQLSRVKGFTLIEIMVVIVILGILAGLVVPNIMGNLGKANIQKAISDVSALENALNMYKTDNYRYPTTDQGLEALVEETDIDPVPRRFQPGGYINRLPQDPWGNEYVLISPGEFGNIDVFSPGEDGEAGTDDDIGNWNLEEWRSGKTKD
ncbi:type II secretion system major pseudopilin GspG [Thalassotalea mangrovi]|uniref:Type II secretion system core protein G n=1 Tax=Thalassotalea mangrovi TaxID=2572245 RepID=A0A4U1B8T0_9GAMM|nr:type II secretion system major pseudopilin GspG [Thalassotalea mangrovi]TKB46678.1 type II secretion system protein GspG [Thalassotalea mangrovi]